ncbi:MAG: hypothetical protein KBT36_18070 [Kurthia sp.]|nr:hypothetical protein [Candidatus Kurthia equi]
MNKRILSFLFLSILYLLSPIVTAKSDSKQTLALSQSNNFGFDNVEFEKSKNKFIKNSSELKEKLDVIANLEDDLSNQIDTLNKAVQKYDLEIGKSLQAKDDLTKSQTNLRAQLKKKQSIKDDLEKSHNETARKYNEFVVRLKNCSDNIFSFLNPFSKDDCINLALKGERLKDEYLKLRNEYNDLQDQYHTALRDVDLNKRKINDMDQMILNHRREHKDAELKMVKAKESIRELNITSMRLLDLGESFRKLNMQMETSKFNYNPIVLYPLFLELNQKYEDSKEPLNLLIHNYESVINSFQLSQF